MGFIPRHHFLSHRRRWLQAATLATWPLSSGAQGLGKEGKDSAVASVRRGRALIFPRDHGTHLDARIEWWYLTGAVRPVGGSRQGSAEQALSFTDMPSSALWGFQITFFRARTGVAKELPGRLAPRQLLFAHAAVTDVAGGRHWHADRITRWNGELVQNSHAFASLVDTDLKLGSWLLKREGAQSNALVLAAEERSAESRDSFAMSLQLQRSQPLLLQGEAGFSGKGPQEQQASHYYSDPQLQVQGQLTAAGQRLQVQGRAWLDHEWSDELLHPEAVGWDWAGINLANGAALTVFRLRRADGSALWAGGSWRDGGQAANGSARNFNASEVRWRSLRTWQSPASGARYPVAWAVECPAGRFEIHALVDAQELDSRRSTGAIYWEGLSELRDERGQRVGLGYLEMTGYAATLRL